MIRAEGYKPIIITSTARISFNPRAAFLMRMAESSFLRLKKTTAQIVEINGDRAKPGAIELAKKVTGGWFKSEVEETDDAYKIKSLNLLTGLRHHIYNPNELKDEARLDLIFSLKSLGHRVGLINPDPENFEMVNPSFLDKAKKASVSEKDIIFLADEGEEFLAFAFPRDYFIQLGDTIYFDNGPTAINCNWNRLVEWTGGLRYNFNPIGFGGMVTVGNTFAFLCQVPKFDSSSGLSPKANRMIRQARKDAQYQTTPVLSRMNKTIYYIPEIWTDMFPPQILEEIGSKKRFLYQYDHTDMCALYLPTENALYFNEPYYLENKGKLDEIVDLIKPNGFGLLPDEDGSPINSLPLPFGGVFMDKAAAGSIKILRNDGIKVETTSRPFGTWAWGMWGGIHCATNTLWLPSQDA